MKKRARKVGEAGMHDVLNRLQERGTNARIHLMGHSFGCIVMSSMLGGPNCVAPLVRPVEFVRAGPGRDVAVVFRIRHPACGRYRWILQTRSG